MIELIKRPSIRVSFHILICSLCFCAVAAYAESPAHAEFVIRVAGPTDSELRSAVLGSSPGDIIEITSDITIGAVITVPVGNSITIRSDSGNQWTLSKSSSGRHFAVNRSDTVAATLTLESIILDGGGNIRGGVSVGKYSNTSPVVGGVLYLNDGAIIQNCGSTDAFDGGGITCYDGAVTVNGGIIRDNSKNMTNGGGGVHMKGAGSFTMNSGSISGNKALGSSTSTYNGGGISAWDNSTITINGGFITGNVGTQHGGGVYAGGNITININGGEISNNSVTTYSACNGGGIYVNSTSTLNMTSGTISGNTAKNNGGGVYVNGGTAAFTMSGGTITRNISTNGGGVFNLSGTFTMSGTAAITDNTASDSAGAAGNGGGVYNSLGHFIMLDGTVSDNTTAKIGGGVRNNGATAVFEMHGGEISGNTSGDAGAGVSNISGATFNLYDGKISNNINKSTYAGGGVNNQASTFVMTGGEISGNRASSGGGVLNWSSGQFTMNGGSISANITTAAEGKGGGVYNYGPATFTMSRGAITGHTTASYGGGIYNAGNAALSIENGTVSGNKAIADGGGIYDDSSSVINITDSKINDNTAANGGGIWIKDLARLFTSGVTFSGNRAAAGYWWTLNVDSSDPTVKMYSETHRDHIKNTTYTSPFTNAYSNYDVNFTLISEATTTYYTVTFDYNFEPSTPTAIMLAENSLITGQPVPSRANYTFKGWYREPGCESPWNFASDRVNSNLTLYAGWALEEIVLPPQPDGETVLPPQPEEMHSRYIYGYPDVTFRPDDNLTRAEAAAIVYRLTDDPEKGASVSSPSGDISAKAWYYHEVAYIESKGIMTAGSDGAFRPDEPVGQREFLEIIRALGAGEYTLTPAEYITRTDAIAAVNSVAGRKLEIDDIIMGVMPFSDITPEHTGYSDIFEASNEHGFVRDENGAEIWTWYLE